jgi:16S rRNA (guanine(966)-N(2))-methyltransferase RsmD
VRIIGGALGGRRLAPVPRRGVRPTADPVREALFNILGPAVAECCFADLAAGTGAVGLEAYSRGARPVILVERDRAALRTIHDNLARLGIEPGGECEVVAEDVARWLERSASPAARLDVVYLDPPWGERRLGRWIDLLARGPRLAPDGLVIVEHRHGEPPPLGGLEVAWQRRYGDTGLTAARPSPA